MITLPTTSFSQPLPFAPTSSTSLLMESLDYDWEIIGMMVEMSGLVQRRLQIASMKTDDIQGKSGAIAMVESRLNEINDRFAWIESRREDIARMMDEEVTRPEAEDNADAMRKVYGVAAFILAALTAFVLIACSPHPAEPEPPMTPLEELYHIRTTPEWPEYRLVDTWLSVGGRYALKDSLWLIHDDGRRTGYAIECRSDGKEIWVATPGKQHALRGALMSSGITARIIVEGANGRPGPAESITFKRVQ